MTKCGKCINHTFSSYRRRQLLRTGRKGRPPALGEFRELYGMGFEVRGTRLIDSAKRIPDPIQRAAAQYALLPEAFRKLYKGPMEFYAVKKLALRLLRQAARRGEAGKRMPDCMAEARQLNDISNMVFQKSGAPD